MSWQEYSDMFDKAQKTGQYRCHVFDMKNSKAGYDIDKVLHLIELFINKIDPKVIHTLPQYNNPFRILGDLIVLVTKKDTISDEEVYKAFKDAKDEVGLDKEYHYLSGYYETDMWAEGGDKYYLGYCIQELEHRSKKTTNLI